MRGMPFSRSGKGALEAIAAQILGEEDKGGTFWSRSSHRKKKGEVLEPTSVLYHRRSPSPPTSTSTLSSSLSGGVGGGGGGGSTDTGGVAAVSENPSQRKEEWATELHTIAGSPEMSGFLGSGEKCGIIEAEDWETMLSAPTASPNQEQTFLRWIMADINDPSAVSKHHHYQQISSQAAPMEFDAGIAGSSFGLVDPLFGFEPIGGITGVTPSSGGFYQSSRNSDVKNAVFMSPPHGMTFFQEPIEEKPQIFGHHLLLQTSTPSNPDLFLPSASFGAVTEQHQTSNLLPPHPKRHHSIPNDPACQIPAVCTGQFLPAPYQLQQRLMKPRTSLAAEDAAAAAAMALQQHQAVIDQLFKAAEFVETGNFISAHGILARLNHQLSSPLGKPLLRSAFYFKEALHLLVSNSYNPPLVASYPHPHRTPFTTSLFTPLDVVLKLSAYKAFSEVSPVLHFTNFTVTQVLLEELGTTDCIHVIDFDIGIGGQWSSFIHELAQRRPSCSTPRLKITAFVSFCAFHPLELHLTTENLSHFAADRNIPFEINISSIESFDPVEILAASAGRNEAIAVNLPVGAGLNPSFTATLHLIKQLTPKIVVSVDQGSDRSDLPFSHHFLHAFQSSMILLDSIDAAGSNLDAANKIERFILQPKIENCVIGRYRATEKMLPWRSLFTSAGFVPVQFSNFTEVQADCLLKRVQVRGFHVEKRQASLYLYWQRGELVSISAWRC